MKAAVGHRLPVCTLVYDFQSSPSLRRTGLAPVGKGPDGTREAHSHFRPTRLEANSVFRWPWPSQGLLGSTVRTSLSSPLPSPVALGPCLWGGGSLQPGQSRCAGSGGWPGAERLQLTGLQPGGHSWRTLCLGETGLLGRTAALSPWGWLQPRAPPLAEPSRAPEGAGTHLQRKNPFAALQDTARVTSCSQHTPLPRLRGGRGCS